MQLVNKLLDNLDILDTEMTNDFDKDIELADNMLNN